VNHYERLGVSPSATIAEIRRGYREAARRAHPDRHGEASAELMTEVNEAWRILSDAPRRQVYDNQLAAAQPTGAAPPSGSASARPASTRPASAGRPILEAVPPARFPWRFMLGLAGAGVIVVIVGHLLTSPQPEPTPDGILRPGDCVVLSPTLEAVEVLCSSEHDAVVSVLVPVEQTCPNDTEAFRDHQGMGTACVVRPSA
jgi:DnaJ domain